VITLWRIIICFLLLTDEALDFDSNLDRTDDKYGSASSTRESMRWTWRYRAIKMHLLLLVCHSSERSISRGDTDVKLASSQPKRMSPRPGRSGLITDRHAVTAQILQSYLLLLSWAAVVLSQCVWNSQESSILPPSACMSDMLISLCKIAAATTERLNRHPPAARFWVAWIASTCWRRLYLEIQPLLPPSFEISHCWQRLPSYQPLMKPLPLKS
jgi:hypothetical protein